MSGDYKTDIPSINRVHEMCIESCDPETFEAWEKVKLALYQNRQSLKHPHDATGEDKEFCAVCGDNWRSSLHRA